MQAKIEATATYTNFSASNDGIELFKTIKQISFTFQSQKYLPHAINKAKWCFFMISQGLQATVQEYLEQWMNHVDIIRLVEANVTPDEGIAKSWKEQGTPGHWRIELRQQSGITQWPSCLAVIGIDTGNLNIWRTPISRDRTII
jgi:hypothetical protein